MHREIITSPFTDDKVIHIKHKSGLEIYICEMKGFNGVQAQFCTKYGSIHRRFRTSPDEDFMTVPDGVAHFLEHKLFENEDCQVFELYAKTGANGNAATSYDRTYYDFYCTANYAESLKILLDFVQKPYFTKENVAKEQGIIAQEIKMSDDSPDWRIFENMLANMYHVHPVRIKIEGTAESIAEIDETLLYKCYNAFYDLNNMCLSIAGNVSADEVIAICDEYLAESSKNAPEVFMPCEPDEIVSPYVCEKLDIGEPLFSLGYKCRPFSSSDRAVKSVQASVTGCLLSDSSGRMCERLLSEGIINSSFSYEVFAGDGYFSLIFSGESEDPEKVRDAIISEIDRISSEGIDEQQFSRIKKTAYGYYIRELNNVDAVADRMMNAFVDGIGPFDTMKALSELTPDDINRFICSELKKDRLVLSVIERKCDK